MKNRVYWCICGFFSIVTVFTLAYYISFQSATSRKGESLISNNNVVSAENVSTISREGNHTERIGENAKYVEQTYDLADSMYSDKQKALPKEYVGLTREELERKLTESIHHVSETDKKNGLLYMTVVTFSKDAVTVRKVYDNKSNYKYYISKKDGFVVVYSNDKKTIVDETGIEYKNLADSQKREVDQGVYIDNLAQLYTVLESYTS